MSFTAGQRAANDRGRRTPPTSEHTGQRRVGGRGVKELVAHGEAGIFDDVIKPEPKQTVKAKKKHPSLPIR